MISGMIFCTKEYSSEVSIISLQYQYSLMSIKSIEMENTIAEERM